MLNRIEHGEVGEKMQEVMFQISLWRWVPAAHGLGTLLRGLAASWKTQCLLSCEEEEFVCQKRSF